MRSLRTLRHLGARVAVGVAWLQAGTHRTQVILPPPGQLHRVEGRICRQVSELTRRRWVLLDAAAEVGRINRLLTGWSDYICLGPVSGACDGK